MPRVLLIKTSSLGDVISNLPVVSDILRAHPAARIDWLVEEAFVAIPALHPGVGTIIPVAVRRWRKHLAQPATWREISAARHSLRAQQYDFVIDTQGLIKSALIATQARGLRAGFDRASIREPLACMAYARRFGVSWQWQAVARNRQLAALALGYEIDAMGLPDYGVQVSALDADWVPPGPYCVLLTATSRADKLWPAERWVALARTLAQRGVSSVFPAGSAAERDAAEAIARQVPGAVVAPPLGLDALARVLAGAGSVIGVDTGLTHLAAAVGRPVVGIYCGSDPAANGVIAERALNLGARGLPPAVDDVLAGLESLTP